MAKEKQSKNSASQNKQKPPRKFKFLDQIITTILILIAIGVVYSSAMSAHPQQAGDISLSQVAEMVNASQVTHITVKGDELTITGKDDKEYTAKKEPQASLADTLSAYGVSGETLRATPIEVKGDSNTLMIVLNILSIIAPIIFIGFFFWYMSRQMNAAGGGMKAFSFGQSKARVTDPKDKRITFDQVAGNAEAKQELLDVVDFLKNPKKYFDVGAQIPKGVLLTGSPGTGKTLLARAVAGEANVPFFHLSGSEFVEMFVGVGASRVRDLFENAKRAAPAIIFIDEIDAVGRARGVGFGGGNDEREQTLNQILVEMDGFEPTQKLVIMAATNRADVLDPALLRPGRFDRRVYLGLPDRKDREAILKIHSGEKPLEETVDLKVLAERTPGFSGADLQSLMNEGAIFAARDNRLKITQTDLLSAIEKVMMGPERKSHLHTEHERRLIAYHEAGHAILASVLPHADPVHKVTIIPRGAAGGYTLSLPLDERKLTTSAQYIDDITVTLGGYAVEKIIYNDVTTGPSNDLQVATRTARDMVTKWGMSDLLGPVAYTTSEHIIPGSGAGVQDRNYSDALEHSIDQEVSRIIKSALVVATDTLHKYRDALESVVAKLLEQETLEQDEFNAIIKKHGIEPKILPEQKTA